MNAGHVPSESSQVHGTRITVILIPKVWDDLRRLEDRTGLSRTDLANRAITLYDFVDSQLRTGRRLIAWDAATGMTQLVQLADASEGQAPDRRSRLSQAGPAVPKRSPRHRRTPRIGPAWFMPLAALAVGATTPAGAPAIRPGRERSPKAHRSRRDSIAGAVPAGSGLSAEKR